MVLRVGTTGRQSVTPCSLSSGHILTSVIILTENVPGDVRVTGLASSHQSYQFSGGKQAVAASKTNPIFTD